MFKTSDKRRAGARRYYKTHKEQVRTWKRNWQLKRRYGITLEQYNALLEQQGGACAICQRVPKAGRLHVDHDHKTKVVRGLLCYRCNRYHVSNHTLETAKRVVAYLEGEKKVA